MGSVQDIFQNHLLKHIHENNRNILENKFPELKTCGHKSYLLFYKYVNDRPAKFYSQIIFEKYHTFLKDEFRNNKNRFINLLKQNYYKIDRAYLSINEINNFDWHDLFENVDEWDLMRFFDQKINPTYLKLIEEVFFPFIYLLAFTSRLNRNKNTDGLDVFNCVEELNISNNADYCAAYDNIIRNGIAHGGVTYRQKEIHFQDKHGNSKLLTDRQLISLVDDLIDICNALVLASKIFYILHLNENLFIPQQLMIEELQSETETPWWKIEGSLNSEIINNKSQLIIYARPNTGDILKAQYSTFMTGALSEQFSPGYDRYFISLHSTKSLPGWAAFDGKELERIRKKGPNTIKDYKGVLIDNLIFFVPKFKLSRFLGRIDTLIHSFRLHFPSAFDKFHEQLNHIKFYVRNVSIHKNGWRLVLRGSVIIIEDDKDIEVGLKKSAKRIIKKAFRKAKREEKYFFVKFLPLGYVRLAIFCKDHRIRKLENYGLGPNLVGTIQIQRIKRIKAPDILGSLIENVGAVRFAWNKAWLESRQT